MTMKAIDAIPNCFGGAYRGRRVLVTGHTGFKGSWLALFLSELGADVTGVSLAPDTAPNHFELLDLPIRDVRLDIRDGERLHALVREARPEVVFHLAAQPLVRRSYAAPEETYSTNVMGTLNVYQACRAAGSVRALVSITTDKVYENREWVWGYREHEPLGGRDPYSASKACAELLSASYRSSYWPVDRFGTDHQTLLCTARAGNVIGGGDWAADRLVPDLVRGAAAGQIAVLRNPDATRPFQHVLEPLAAYLQIGQRLLAGDTDVAAAFNIGPGQDGVCSVLAAAEALAQGWDAVRFKVERPEHAPHEARLLGLDCALSRAVLGFQPVWDGAPAFVRTAQWYRAFHTEGEVLSRAQLRAYVDDAAARALPFTRTEP